MPTNPKSAVLNTALSVRQPYAEQIMAGSKKVEYRSRATSFPKRIYIYASQTATEREKQSFKKIKKQPGDFPVGMIVGTVEIIDCTGRPGDYKWHLVNPKRLKKPVKPDNHPQPVWFKPFKE